MQYVRYVRIQGFLIVEFKIDKNDNSIKIGLKIAQIASMTWGCTFFIFPSSIASIETQSQA